ncbi:MAG: hypothetical protein AB1728_11100 [Bacteroidota bacterium]
MDRVKYIAIALIGLGAGIWIGMSLKTNPIATINIANTSQQEIASAQITVGMTTYVIEHIGQNSTKSVNVIVAGEAGYKIRVNFANGDTLANWTDIEPGRKITETVSDSAMKASVLEQ